MNIITTICGDDIAGFSGDEGPATKAKLNQPEALCLDNRGNIYIADFLNDRIRKINLPTGIITTVAGITPPGGVGGFSGDGGPATNALLWGPCAVFSDTIGNVYFADAENNRIRKITIATGIITTVAGSGPIGLLSGDSTGDGGQATNATLSEPVGLCVDKFGNIYIADYDNNKIRKVDAATGTITTIAGKGTKGYSGGFAGYSGDGGPAVNATFSGTIQVFADSSGDIFICDQYNHVVRKVNATTGIISTIAGTGIGGYSGDNGLAIHAQLNQPGGVFVDKQGNVFIAEFINGTIRRIDATTKIITTVAGIGTWGYSGDGGLATNAQLIPDDVFLDSYGTMYIADYGNHAIRKVYDTTLRVGVSSVALPNREVQIFPNPAKDKLNITNASRSELKIFNLLSQEVFFTSIISDKEVLNVGSLASGIYIVHIARNDGVVQNVRLLKE